MLKKAKSTSPRAAAKSAAKPAASARSQSGHMLTDRIMMMQQTIGNQAVQRMVAGELSSSVLIRIQRIISEQLGVEEQEVAPEASFVHDLGADAADMTELAMAFEQEFAVQISDEQMERAATVRDAAALISSLAKG
jgi:acyl carrier protein